MSDPNSAESWKRWLHRLARFTSACCFVLLFIGGLVTSHNAGLSVPDWPSSYGWSMFTFPMHDWIGNIYYEHTHRLFASFVGFLILAQTILFQWKEQRTWVKRLNWLALFGVVCQGILGGITVLYYLPPAVSSAHAALAQTVFCLTVGIAMVTASGWSASGGRRKEARAIGLRTMSVVTVGVIFVQLMIGAVMRHTWSGLAIPTFPLAFGKIIPDFTSFGIAINFAHRVGALAVTACVIWCVMIVFRDYRDMPSLVRPAWLLLGLIALQLTLGAITILSMKAVTPTTLHVSGGAAILGTMVFLMVRSRHLLIPSTTSVQTTGDGPISQEPLRRPIVSEA